MRQLLEQKERLLIGGHRGCACRFPENSIEAMEEGLRRGADYLEIDIQLTKDGIPVVYHDVRLEKKTELTGYVHEFELQKLKKHCPSLCTLQEAMEWGFARDAYFALELKTVPLDMQAVNLELVRRIIPIIKQSGMMGQVFVFGQDYQVLRHVKEIDAKVQIGLIVPFVPEDPVELMRSMDALVYLSYIYNMTPEIIKDLQSHGYYVSGAILRDDQWIQRAISLGVDMFELDEPERVQHSAGPADGGVDGRG